MLQKVLGYCYFKHPIKTIYCINLGEIKKKKLEAYPISTVRDQRLTRLQAVIRGGDIACEE